MSHRTAPTAGDRPYLWALAAVTAIALAMRLAHLGTPSLWWDEILVPLTASQSVMEILARCRVADFHPPGFYLLIKAVMAAGVSDFALRLPSALAGTAVVPVAYALVRPRLGRGPALLTAAMLAVAGPLLLWSRQVRPYSLITLFSLLAAKGLLDWRDEPRPSRMVGAAAATFAYLALHYLSLLVLGAQALFTAVSVAADKKLRRPGPLALYAISALLGFAAAYVFFHATAGEMEGTSALETAATWLRTQSAAATGSSAAPAQAVVVLTMLAGLPVLWRRCRPLCLMTASMVLAPAAALVAVRYASYFSPWHLAFAVPFVAVAASAALSALPRPDRWMGPAALALAAWGLVWFLGPAGQARYCAPQSHTGTYKAIARTLPGLVRPGALVVYSATEEADGVGWYLNRFTAQNPLTGRSVDLSGPTAALDFVSFRDFGHLARTEAELAKRCGAPPRRVDRATGVTVYHFTIARTPPAIAALPGSLRLELMPRDVAAQASAVSGIRLLPVFGGRAVPEAGGKPTRLAYTVALPQTAAPSPIFVRLDVAYDNPGPGNSLAMTYAFDDDAPRQAFASTGPDPAEHKTVILRPGRPVSRLSIAFDMQTTTFQPTMTGNAGPTLRLTGVDIRAGDIAKETLDSTSLALNLDGIGPAEGDAAGHWRWAMGPTATCRFRLPGPEAVRLGLSLGNPLPGQRISVLFNGVPVTHCDALPARPWLVPACLSDAVLPGQTGENVVELRFSDWNGKPDAPQDAFAPGDARPMAAPLVRLFLERAATDACLVY
ncbi:glycosyltransferase family 39 protein [Solidesulfovibrio sp. C21]|uniref:glycosyltransferase family 39 protein n=1 Tax=Solidesulfovibrio sp. C21 TaxID=3398613 RepID=UPI0039FD09D5